MSHYSVLVVLKKEDIENSIKDLSILSKVDDEEIQNEILDNIDYIVNRELEPFDEDGYSIYLTERVDETEDYKKYYEEYKKEYEARDKETSSFEKLRSFEEFCNIDGYQVDEDGKVFYMRNPNAKWDWYEIGGRWSNCIPLKTGGKANIARIEDIDFTPNKEKYESYLEYFDDIIAGKPDVFTMYTPEYYLERYKTRENYALEQSSFSTYAILYDGKWHEAGEMGWFGISSAKPEDEAAWHKNYKDLIDSMPKDAIAIMVDCHI